MRGRPAPVPADILATAVTNGDFGLMTTADRLVQCFSAVFPRLSEDEIRRASPISVGAWDSISTLTLTGMIGEQFGVSLPEDELDELLSFDLILEYLRSRKSVS